MVKPVTAVASYRSKTRHQHADDATEGQEGDEGNEGEWVARSIAIRYETCDVRWGRLRSGFSVSSSLWPNSTRADRLLA